MAIRVNLFGTFIVVDRSKVILKAHPGARRHLTIFFRPRSYGGTQVITPHVTDERRRSVAVSVRIPLAAVTKFFERFAEELATAWRAAAEPTCIEQLEREGWALVDISNETWENLATAHAKNGVYRVNVTALSESFGTLTDHVVALSALTDDGRLKTILREGRDGELEARYLCTDALGRWVTVPHEWLPQERVRAILCKLLPRQFWSILMEFQHALGLGDADRTKHILAEHGLVGS